MNNAGALMNSDEHRNPNGESGEREKGLTDADGAAEEYRIFSGPFRLMQRPKLWMKAELDDGSCV